MWLRLGPGSSYFFPPPGCALYGFLSRSMGADGMGSSSSSMTADVDDAEGGGRPRSYDRCRGFSADDGPEVGDLLERVA